MGNTWEIEVWAKWSGGYKYEEFWRGESTLSALWYFIKARRMGYGCVRLSWR